MKIPFKVVAGAGMSSPAKEGQNGFRSTNAKCLAFTLIEIIIVVAVIGMLAAIAASAVIKARDKAATTTCISNLEQIARAKSIWAFENKAVGSTPVVMTDICGSSNYLKQTPVCPMNGTYTVGIVSEDPTCSVAGHEIPN